MAMGILKGIGKGIGTLLRRNKGRGPNRKLTPEEVAQRNLESAKEATQVAKGRYEKASSQLDEILQPYRMKGSTAMRAKQVGDETMEMIRDSVMKMDLPADKKVEAIKSAATAVRNASPAQLAEANPAQLSMDIIKVVSAAAGGAGFVGGAMVEGMAREGRLPEMIQDSFLIKPEFRGMRDTGPARDSVGQALAALGGITTRDVSDEAIQEMMDATQMSPGEKTAEFLMDYLQPLPRSMGKPRD
tara:strand:- start:382 stop:1113 length:732 start_codon:yes stop_codon:yes gene_type:complete